MNTFIKLVSVLSICFLLMACQDQNSTKEAATPKQSSEKSAAEEETDSSSENKEQQSEDHADESEHNHDHDHDHDEEAEKIYSGYFEDSQVKDRPLSDWQGDWQSVYPFLQDGTLDEVFAHKAKTKGDMTAEEYKEYYEVGYRTDVNRIVIKENTVSFFKNEEEISGEYNYDGYEILTYPKGNRGVRFIFKLVEESEGAPSYIQFSDHGIFPNKADHYHLYWGDDREALLDEITHWPTYYPSDMDGHDIAHEMIAH
ncbi:ZinT/AdcA family metal-binding protein [Bacillus lacus]|uniref:ZinT/AdcA family metal-binding protein n=1 Tax=Metabacillus lacus TaxID=1983721 RepID=A0A7X2M1H7_9BACI|nr:metal-binding protein ZinT [Metabacillus lacus]MRX74419.1 ZinT/AdcA family metal-binding protein [Metabacillus lacus]